eukprot:11973334-Alexandrium_andersonii.AAC.1
MQRRLSFCAATVTGFPDLTIGSQTRSQPFRSPPALTPPLAALPTTPVAGWHAILLRQLDVGDCQRAPPLFSWCWPMCAW